MRRTAQERLLEQARACVFEHAYGFIKAARSDKHREALAMALLEGFEVAESALDAIPDAEYAGDAGVYEFDLHRAVAEAQ